MADIKMNVPDSVGDETPEDKLYRERAAKRASQEAGRERERAILERTNSMRFWDLEAEHGHDRVQRL